MGITVKIMLDEVTQTQRQMIHTVSHILSLGSNLSFMNLMYRNCRSY